MAQLRVIRRFRDVTNEARVFGVGEIITITDAMRVENIVSQGLAEVVLVEPEKVADVEKPKRTRKKKVEND